MSAETDDPRLAIWQYATPEERQRVIDARWTAGMAFGGERVFYSNMDGLSCCPWGVAVPEFRDKETADSPGTPFPYKIAALLISRTDKSEPDDIISQTCRFVGEWDDGHIHPRRLRAYLRRLNAQEATK